MILKTPEIVSFHQALTTYYYENGRHAMPWRQPDKHGAFDPYKILVSEVMLQQTQVDRVTPKYQQFLEKFPSIEVLAKSPISEVLIMWNGLGYNRRAKYIWQAAQMIEADFGGVFPGTREDLQRIPGIGSNTAGAIMAYAHNLPVTFIETNIRTVIIHHFFKDKKDIPDTAIKEVMDQVVPQSSGSDTQRMQGAILTPREFYWALMDYGSHLKKSLGNVSRASKHYKKQSAFQGSTRQVRGQVIRLLAEEPKSREQLAEEVKDSRLEEVLATLTDEGMILDKGESLSLTE
jgi:A/G-specific adenine glycosylase